MFTRHVNFVGAKDIDSGIEFVRDVVTPVLHSQHGWRGTTVSADRINRFYSVLTLWESEADRDGSESALLKVRDEGHKVIGGEISVEYFEQVTVQIATKPTTSSKLIVTKVSMDAAKVDENIAFFAREIAPQITSAPGFEALRQLVNRTTGESMVGTTWSNADARRKALAMAEERQRNGQMPVTFRERSERDILFIDLPL
jgi:heme-degrading monooxygenase HmoA